MDTHERHSATALTRRQVMAGAAAMGGAALIGGGARAAAPATQMSKGMVGFKGEPIKAFCIDFNWGKKGPAEPGLFAQADPEEHVRWYQELGCNTIQTFCVSYNGYAWYPSGVAPVTPGLKYPDFLGRVVDLGHKANMLVMGYFCGGSNAYWEDRHPTMAHIEDRGSCNVPFTLEYLDYFCRQVEDALKKTGVDGFMIDWIRPTKHNKWLDCEKQMWQELLGEKFPESGSPSAEAVLEFDRRSMERAWRHMRWAIRATRPAVVWTNHPFLKQEYPLWEGQSLLTEADWILNESHEIEHVDWLQSRVGPKTLIVQNLCGWQDHDASMWRKLDPKKFGFYGFAKADEETTLPDVKLEWNAKNIEIIRQAYREI
ncbi:MAG TPA: hypothetical protein VLM89_12990 [Phycisphaerae bacterium]|nr:hypothetical protein [Phycisphaerae bacterium]